MHLFPRIRYNVFWALDIIKGNSIKKDLNDIKQSLELSTFAKIKKKNEPVLERLLQATIQDSKYYEKYKGFKRLEDFPVVNKHIIKNNFDAINIKSKTSKNKHTLVSTSGSTGTPFSIYHSKRKKTRNTADVLYFSNLAGYDLGNQLYILRVWGKRHRKSNLICLIQNIKKIDLKNLNDERIANLIQKMQSNKSPKNWLAFSSGFKLICDFLDETKSAPLDCNIKSIIGMAETFNETIKNKMQYYFNCPAISRYSNTENGILAQQLPEDSKYSINWASYIIEILDYNNDIPVSNDNLGRIVVTDLYNFATPMIRYDTGDIGSLTASSRDNFPMLNKVEGRKTDFLTNTKGEMISPYVLNAYIDMYPELKQIQFIQSNDLNYRIKINSKKKFEKENELLSLFRKDMGKNAKIHLEYVDEIPVLASGKRKITQNNCIEENV